MELPLPDVDNAVLVRTWDEVGEILLPGGTEDTLPDITGIVTEVLPPSDADEPLGELVPVVDENPPLG